MSYRVLSGFLILVAAAACSSTPSQSVVDVPGVCADVFSAQVCTWARVEGATLVEAGAVIPVASIANAPADAPMTWPPQPVVSIDMPDVVVQQAGLRNLVVNWEAGGHPPGAFLTPHFDFHFYAIPSSDVAAIDCSDDRKPDALPAAYGLPDIPLPPHMAEMMGVDTLVGLCVPQMGMHAIPTAEIERTDAFDGTMVVGYYGGAPIFIEPMISQAMLLKRESFDLAVPTVPGLAGRRPTKFRAEYDPESQAYRFTLSAFTPAG